MSDVTGAKVAKSLLLVAKRVEENKDYLCELDGEVGDGLAGGERRQTHAASLSAHEAPPSARTLGTAAPTGLAVTRFA